MTGTLLWVGGVLCGLWLLLWSAEVLVRILAPVGWAILMILLLPAALVAMMFGRRPQSGYRRAISAQDASHSSRRTPMSMRSSRLM